MRPVAFKCAFFKSSRILIQTGATADGALDVILRHALRARFVDDEPQFVVAIGVGAFPRGDGDFAAHAGKDRAALGVIGALLAFDGSPVAVT